MDEERVRDARQVEYGELPELARGLRALGSSRHEARSQQAQFFQPLLDARRKAAGASDADGKLAAFDTRELRKQLDRAIERIVAEWPDARPSARRAVRAQLAERVAPFHHALATLAERASDARSAAKDARLQSWRAWTVQLAAVFVAADRSWLALQSAVSSIPAKSAK